MCILSKNVMQIILHVVGSRCTEYADIIQSSSPIYRFLWRKSMTSWYLSDFRWKFLCFRQRNRNRALHTWEMHSTMQRCFRYRKMLTNNKLLRQHSRSCCLACVYSIRLAPDQMRRANDRSVAVIRLTGCHHNPNNIEMLFRCSSPTINSASVPMSPVVDGVKRVVQN